MQIAPDYFEIIWGLHYYPFFVKWAGRGQNSHSCEAVSHIMVDAGHA
jgi:hypothetical protein